MLPAVLIATEIAFVILAAVLILRVWRQFKRNRTEVGDFWTALEEAVGQQVGPIAARLIVGEPKLWAAIFIWISGHSRRDARSFHYSASSNLGLVSVVVLGLILLEGVGGGLLARLAPWPWLSPALIIISAYAAVWIIGIYASLRTFPHLVTEQVYSLDMASSAKRGSLGERSIRSSRSRSYQQGAWTGSQHKAALRRLPRDERPRNDSPPKPWRRQGLPPGDCRHQSDTRRS